MLRTHGKCALDWRADIFDSIDLTNDDSYGWIYFYAHAHMRQR